MRKPHHAKKCLRQASASLIAALDPLFAAYAKEREPNERFGEFVIRAGFAAKTGNGRDFHANAGAKRAA